jgi:FixJ family two-component response regulator
MKRCLRRDGNDGHLSRLTERQNQVLKMIAEDHSTEQIGNQLNLSVKMVETYRSQIMENWISMISPASSATRSVRRSSACDLNHVCGRKGTARREA